MRQPFLNARLQGFGTTIFAEMSALAVATGAVNLGQGFPDTDGPPEVMDAAVAAIREGRNQYPPGPGVPELRQAVAAHQQRFYGLSYDPDTEVLVTAGATEAIAASLLALCETGDEVIALEPYYDSYAACIAMAGAVRRPITLRPPTFTPDLDALADAINPRTRLILLNTPHNPTGTVLDAAQLAEIARLCGRARPAGGGRRGVRAPHLRRRARADRRVPRHAGANRHDRVRGQDLLGDRVEGRLGDGSCRPRHRGAHGQAVPDVRVERPVPAGDRGRPGVAGRLLPRAGRRPPGQRDRLVAGLEEAGLDVFVPDGTYFVTTDISPLGAEAAGGDGLAFCRSLPERCGVVAVPCSVFYDDQAAGRSLVRFAFCKRDDVIDEAVARLKGLRR